MAYLKILLSLFFYVIFAEIKSSTCSSIEGKCAYRSVVSGHRHFSLSNGNQTCVPFGNSDLALQIASYASLPSFGNTVVFPLFGAREKRGITIYDRYMTGPSSTTIWTTWSSSEAAYLVSYAFYRSPLLDIWAQIKWRTVEVELYTAGVVKAKLVFNATGSTIDSWFSKESLITSWPWALGNITNKDYTFFSAYGEFRAGVARRFAIMRYYNGCPGDYGVMAVFEAVDVCEYADYLPLPSVFIYAVSPTNDVGTFSTQKAYAEEFRISATADFSDHFVFDKK